MFSFVNNIEGLTRPREVQPTDANLQEKQSGGDTPRRHQKRSENEESEKGVDLERTVLSVKALSLYFENLIEKRLLNEKNKITERQNTNPWFKGNASNDRKPKATANDAVAASAYRHALKTATPNSNGSAHNMSGGFTIKEIYDLVQELRDLKKEGVLTLRVDSQKNFTQAVIEAVSLNRKA